MANELINEMTIQGKISLGVAVAAFVATIIVSITSGAVKGNWKSIWMALAVYVAIAAGLLFRIWEVQCVATDQNGKYKCDIMAWIDVALLILFSVAVPWSFNKVKASLK